MFRKEKRRIKKGLRSKRPRHTGYQNHLVRMIVSEGDLIERESGAKYYRKFMKPGSVMLVRAW